MPAFYARPIHEFIEVTDSELTGILSIRYAQKGFSQQRTSQTLAWFSDALKLQRSLKELLALRPEARSWTVVLEFEIPRKEKRIDVLLLAGDRIIVLELKSGMAGAEAFRQAEEYALLLHYFHQPSFERHIHTYLVSPSGAERNRKQLFLPLPEAPSFWIEPVQRIAWNQLGEQLASITFAVDYRAINPAEWLSGAYRPVPTIIDAARELESGLKTVREIAHSQAARHDVDALTSFVASVIERSKAEKRHAICFLTGVPGSGKTLVGLNLALAGSERDEPIHFMSGNAPLVGVLQSVLARAHRQRMSAKAEIANLHAKTLIENVHLFATEYFERDTTRPPSNRIVIFDEAQRAWNREQNLRKFKRSASEPEMLLSIMERHEDWSVVIALVGGGQEINSGEAGLSEWGRALMEASRKQWIVYASPEALHGGASVAGIPLFGHKQRSQDVRTESQLHLDVSLRNLRAEQFTRWVNFVIEGQAKEAQTLIAESSFPIVLTRNLDDARLLLDENTLGESRSGLVGSSKAARLRAEGLEPDSSFHANYPWEHWYLSPSSDVRSSFQHEVFATEFEIQGLELDWVAICWGGDLIWSARQSRWIPREFRVANSKWRELTKPDQRIFRKNSYRVLLTRARQGIVIFVPEGDEMDSTRVPSEFNETFEFLRACGAKVVDTVRSQKPR